MREGDPLAWPTGATARVRKALKRGALLVAANWPVVAIQFAAESSFKLLLAIPIVGGLSLVALALGADLAELLDSEWRDLLGLTAGALRSHPVTLASFALAFAIVLIGGSALMFLVKGGTVGVLVESERLTGPLERPPLRFAGFWRASHVSIETFLDGCRRLFGRYLVLGFALLGVYALSGGLFLAAVFAGYRLVGEEGFLFGWTVLAALASTALVAWITLINLVYLLTQMVVASDDCTVGSALRRVGRFVTSRAVEVGVVFGFLLALVALATIASVVVAASLGLISFIPLVGLAVLPLQAVAWLLRGLVFQYVGLTALSAYLALYRMAGSGTAGPWAADDLPRVPPVGRTA